MLSDDTVSLRYLPRRTSKNYDLQFANGDRFKTNNSVDTIHKIIVLVNNAKRFRVLCGFYAIQNKLLLLVVVVGRILNTRRRYPFTGRGIKESEDIHIPGIYVGGGWRTGCGRHPQSADRVEELEESVWSIVRQEN